MKILPKKPDWTDLVSEEIQKLPRKWRDILISAIAALALKYDGLSKAERPALMNAISKNVGLSSKTLQNDRLSTEERALLTKKVSTDVSTD